MESPSKGTPPTSAFSCLIPHRLDGEWLHGDDEFLSVGYESLTPDGQADNLLPNSFMFSPRQPTGKAIINGYFYFMNPPGTICADR